MRLPSYPEYKDSGVDWLGEVPAHWSIRRLGFYFDERREKVSDKDYPALSVTKLGIVPQLDTAAKTDDGDNRKKVCAGDFVINSRSDRKGSSGASRLDGSVSLINTVLRPVENIDIEFAHHLLRSVSFQEEYYRYGKGIVADLWSTNYSEMRNIILALPDINEQSAIATFLDRETGKIDALIAEQEKLLTLLAEKHQATISHAVTKGLNPHVPMKDSGVEWLGEVPVHWKVGKIQSFARRESGHTPSRQHPEYWEDCTIPWFSLADVWQIRTSNIKYVYETKELVSELGLANSSARLLPAGTVMLSRTASVGYSAIMGCDMATTQDFINWVCKPELSPEFLLYVLRGMKTEFDRLMMGSTHQTIYMPDVAKLTMTLPDITEQAAIVGFIDRETTKLDALAAETTRAIELLKERRSALISTAVTGQIDVRQVITAEMFA